MESVTPRPLPWWSASVLVSAAGLSYCGWACAQQSPETDRPKVEDTFRVSGKWEAISARFSGDGRFVYAFGANTIIGWRLDTKKEAFRVGSLDQILNHALSPDGQKLATAHWYTESIPTFPNAWTNITTATLRVWDTSTSTLLKNFPIDGKAVGVALSPDGRSIAAGGTNGRARIWDLATGKVMLTVKPKVFPQADPANADIISVVGISSTGKQLLTKSLYAVQLWDIPSGNEITLEEPPSGLIFSAAFSRDGKRLAADGSHLVPLPPGDKRRVTNVRLDMATGQERKFTTVFEVRVWCLAAGKRITFLENDQEIRQVLFHPNGKHLLTRTTLRENREKTGTEINWWDLDQQRCSYTWAVDEDLRHIALSPDGRRIATCHGDGTVRVWRLPPLGDPKR